MENNGNDYGIRIDSYRAGDDYVFLITGGEAHVGAVACAYWHEGGVRSETISVPGHREGELVKELAENAASKLRHRAAVIMGIHIDHATKQDIAQIIALVHAKMRAALESYIHENGAAQLKL
ncbi:hypothetical protein SAMN04487970_1003148 [Paenibacillus tianmuensis]|uniref:Prenylated flavin chaperone LpdD-like domain-containing protein n=1 Tax=Paenibacillus tianmuensis TaxID=624147 RepID=A0A1G4PP24_9BACL|nr:hypothetical protein [Paenibacillus tianmuensis]SCW34017.1 hypothetical protein SAMN04487970_1003148 [Paenibacillus tianmuensis]